ncbi:MAG: transketolase [Halobacteriovoraceae bacterium]|jgi:transketolase|nr:transketolase [Halobacteriovoraceae bacterium]MBT5094588.1 transketolase [Halobacteriovoraceae bacterium]
MDFKSRCKKIREEILELARHSRRGHIPSAFSLVETLVTLYDDVLKFDAKNPDWKLRDRLILSKGHGCMALYSILADKNFFSREHFAGFCQLDGILGGHPTREKIPGCEASTGSLGHGLSIAIGMALNAKIEELNYRTFVILGDGECNEGSIWEAALSASHNRLDNLYVLIDYNKYQSYGSTNEVCDLEPFADKWRAFGFDTHEFDMRKKPEELKSFFEDHRPISGTPVAIICHTIKGQGAASLEGNLSWHHRSKISDEDLSSIKDEL